MKIVMMVLVCLTLAHAGDLESAMEAIERGDFKTAVSHLTAASEAGDPVAQQNLGVMYENGYGVEKNPETASYWFKRATQKERVAMDAE